ncbi:hypothetical protein pb186bvf_001924 [Paramecium bursaria]
MGQIILLFINMDEWIEEDPFYEGNFEPELNNWHSQEDSKQNVQSDENQLKSPSQQFQQQKQLYSRNSLSESPEWHQNFTDFQIQGDTIDQCSSEEEEELELDQLGPSSQSMLGLNLRIKKESKRQVKTWTTEEDQKLMKFYRQYHGNWEAIAREMIDRTVSQCKQHWRRIDPSQQQKRNPWTKEEDDLIKAWFQPNQNNWAFVASKLTKRTGKQVRDRYNNYLRPGIINNDWTQEEDYLLLKYYSEMGPKWTAIANQIKGRTENMVKNRFQKIKQPSYIEIDDYIVRDPDQDTSKKKFNKTKVAFDFKSQSLGSQTFSTL